MTASFLQANSCTIFHHDYCDCITLKPCRMGSHLSNVGKKRKIGADT
ncbi:MAG: hypothetical protein J6B34_00350 [Clostridia bacterium]|nr:hypothetical protein [Clostridia bacterium]